MQAAEHLACVAQPGDQINSFASTLCSQATLQILEDADSFSDVFDLTPLPANSAVSLGLHTPTEFHDHYCSENIHPNTASPPFTAVKSMFGKALSPNVTEPEASPALKQLCLASALGQQTLSPQVMQQAQTPRTRGAWAAPQQRAALTDSKVWTAPAPEASNCLQPMSAVPQVCPWDIWDVYGMYSHVYV